MQSEQISFLEMQKMRRFSQLWDRYANSGNFLESLPHLWEVGSPFWKFYEYCDWFVARVGQSHSVSLTRLMESLFVYLTEENKMDPSALAEMLWEDYKRGGSMKVPNFLKHHLDMKKIKAAQKKPKAGPARQARHLG